MYFGIVFPKHQFIKRSCHFISTLYSGRRLVLSNYPLFYLLKVIFLTTKTACPAHNFCEQSVLKNTCLTETFYNCSFDYIRFSPLFCTAYAMGTSRLVLYSNLKAKSTKRATKRIIANKSQENMFFVSLNHFKFIRSIIST